MKRKTFITLFLITTIITLSGCTSENDSSALTYTKITATQAKEMIDKDSNLVILDVRTEEEFAVGHIEGALLIPDTEIEQKAEDILTDKSATILVYCRSGRRSALAAKDLIDLGYTKVYDFGGINDWEYDVTTE